MARCGRRSRCGEIRPTGTRPRYADLIVRNRLLIKATGRVSGTIRYGQIQIECGGQIFGDIQTQPADELGKAPLPGGFPAFVPDDRSKYSLTWIMGAPGAGVPAVPLRAEMRPTDLLRPVQHPKPGAQRLSLRNNQSLAAGASL